MERKEISIERRKGEGHVGGEDARREWMRPRRTMGHAVRRKKGNCV